MRINKGYETLADVLQRALDQAQDGKGAERHADGKPFHVQPMQQLCRLYGAGFALGQAAKRRRNPSAWNTAQRSANCWAQSTILPALSFIWKCRSQTQRLQTTTCQAAA